MKKVQSITINPSTISIVQGTSYNSLVTQVLPDDAENKDLLWSSDNPEIASVIPELGCIYGNKVGTANICAESTDGGNVKAYCTVNVEERIRVSSITLNRSSMTIGKGEQWQLSAQIYPEDAFDKTLQWCSSNCYVADVDENGAVMAKTVGRTVISAMAKDGSTAVATCTVDVRQTTTCSAQETPKNSVKASYLSVPVDVYSGAHRLNHTLMSLFGGQNLKFRIIYDSTHLAKGEIGIGWYHNFEKHLDVFGDVAYVYSTPSVYSKYIATSPCGSQFTCTAADKNGYVLNVYNNNTYPYVINCNSQRTEYYNCDGDLAKIVDHQGFETVIQRSGTLISITDKLSGKVIRLEKDACCRIKRIYDDAGRQAFLRYTNDLLTCVTDVNGNSYTYTYDSSKRIKTGTDPENVKYFENTYDGYGRLSAQMDALGKSFIFLYDGDKRIITDRNGYQSTREFNNKGLLVKYTDENGNIKTYAYDSRYNVIKETDARGYSEEKLYNSFNKPTWIKDKNCGETTFEYDGRGNVTKITYPCICNECSTESYQYNSRNQITRHVNTRGTATAYTYDANGMPLTKKEGARLEVKYTYVGGLLKAQKDARGHETKYTHNAYGMLETVTDADGKTVTYVYDLLGNVKSITDAHGKTLTNTYDKNYQKTSVTDCNGNITEFTYNGLMRNDSVTLPDKKVINYGFDNEERVTRITDQFNQVTEITYDEGGRLKTRKLPDDAITEYGYDKMGNVTSEKNPKLAITTRTYDGMGNVLTVRDHAGNVTRYEYNEQSKPVKVTNAAVGVFRYEYNKAGDVVAETDALNNRKEYTYDAYGNLIKIKDAKCKVTEYNYDANNNLTSVKNALGETVTYQYNSLNQCEYVTDAKNHTVHYEYDALGRRTKVTDARGHTFETQYDACGNVTKTFDADGALVTDTVYNELNLPKVVTDATGKTLTYSYNAIGKINTVTDQFGNTQTYGYDVCGRNNKVTDDLGGVSEVEYDLLGNVTRLKGPLGGATNYTYDQMGRLTSESTTSGGTIRYQYNELNLRKNLTNARGHIIHFSYDKNGRIDGYTTPEDVVTFEYDDNGNITRTRSGDGDIHRTFDELNRVTSYTDICCNRIGYEYDEAGNLKKLTYPDNTSVSYEYDENNNLKKVTDWAGRVTEYTYDKNNRVIGIVKPNGTTVTTTYERNKVKTTVEKTAAGAVITGFEYTYDNLSRVTEEKVLANSTKVCYNYDDLSRVTERTIKNLSDDSVIATETFTYDKAGNIMSAPSGTFQYDTNNRLVVFNGQNVSYDCDGNMTLGNGMDCGYDSQNRLLYAGEHDYFYNAENVRIRNLCADEDTSYVYDTNCKLSRLLVKTTNGVTTKYVYGLGLIGEEVNNTFKTYHFDSRGSTVAITDANGNITDTFAYDTYGKRTVLSGTSDIIFGYNGRDGVVTDKNGLIYMRARYYSPEMRRFINADIIAGNINNAVTLNRYAYANANPVMNIDPLGLSCPSCMSGEIDSCSCRNSNTNVKTNSRPSTNNFGNEDRNGQVLNKDKYVQDLINKYNGKNSVSKTPTAQAEPEEQQERDYEAEAIAKKNNDDSINAPEGDWSWNNDNDVELYYPEYDLSKIFGAGIVQSQTYKAMEAKTFLGGFEMGTSTTAVICGDISKPISVYTKNASEWWRIWEYKVGIQINIGNGGFYLEANPLEYAVGVSVGNTSVEIMAGVDKIGYTTSYEVDFSSRTSGGVYEHGYIRTIPTAAAVVTAYYCLPALVGALGTATAVGAPT